MISTQSIHPRITLQMLHPSFNWIADTASQNLTWNRDCFHCTTFQQTRRHFLHMKRGRRDEIFQSTHLYAGAKTQKELHKYRSAGAAPDRRLGEKCSVGGFVLRWSSICSDWVFFCKSVRLRVWSITFVSIGLWTFLSWWRQSRAANETDPLLIFLQVRKKWVWYLEMEKLNLSPSQCKISRGFISD